MRLLLPFIFVLICPLMMLFMMRGVHGRGAHSDDRQRTPDHQDIVAAGEDPRIVELRRQRDELGARVDELEAQMSRLDPTREAEPQVHASV